MTKDLKTTIVKDLMRVYDKGFDKETCLFV